MNNRELLTILALRTIVGDDKTAEELSKLMSCNDDTLRKCIKELENKKYIEVHRLTGYVYQYKVLLNLELSPPKFLSLPLPRITKEYLSRIYLNYNEFNLLFTKTKQMKLLNCPTWLGYNNFLKSLEPYGGITDKLFNENYINRTISNTVRDTNGYLKYIYHDTGRPKNYLCKVCGTTDPTMFNKKSKSCCTHCTSGIHDSKIIDIAKYFKYKFSCIRGSATKRDLAFNLTVEDLISQYLKQNKVCAFSKKEFIMGDENYMLSIDRIDSTKGYVKNNFQFIRMVYNRMKGTLPNEEFLTILKDAS